MEKFLPRTNLTTDKYDNWVIADHAKE